MNDHSESTRLIVVSNRLPYVISRQDDGEWQVTGGSGGLVSALEPALKNHGGVWVGWPGIADVEADEAQAVLDRQTRNVAYRLKPVSLTTDDVGGFYFGFSNEVIWPLFHDFTTSCDFDPDYWRAYFEVNRKYAQSVAEIVQDHDFVWVHDYHLMLLGGELRRRGVTNPTGFFLHIPFPPLDLFLRLPWRDAILQGLLQFDLVGFQTDRDLRNFLQCARALGEDVDIDEQEALVSIHARTVTQGDGARIHVRAGSFPIGVDYGSIEKYADSEKVGELVSHLQATLHGRKMLLGMDRMDYTKGILNRLEAFDAVLRRHPELVKQVRFVQHLAPSREDIPDYHALKSEVERLVSEINGKYTRAGWVPIHYMHHSMAFEQVVAYYRAADVAVVTPLKDGMNLVAKEYCAAHTDEDGVLVLSEFAGAAGQLGDDAVLVNPYDIEGTSESIHAAITMPPDERRRRMRALRRIVHDSDVFAWVESFLAVAMRTDPGPATAGRAADSA